MARWDLTHNPEARPLGCNGKYGGSGVKVHTRRGTEICERCRVSMRHYRREKRRGQHLARRRKPCGTHAGYRRHERAKEPICFKCRVAETEYRAARKTRK